MARHKPTLLAWSVALALWAAMFPVRRASAQVVDDRLEVAEEAYRSGRYAEVLKTLGTLEDIAALPTKEELIHGYRLMGLSDYYLKRFSNAHEAFFGLLKQDPYYQLTLEPPDAVAFFNKVRQDENVSLEPIRLAIQEEKKSQEQMEEALKRADEISRLSKIQLQPSQAIERKIAQNSILVALMPFGLGQFQNGNTKLGVAFAVGEGASALGSVVSYLAVELLRESDGTFSSANYPFARRFNGAKWISAGIFYALWVAGAIEANVDFVPERVISTTTTSLPGPANTPAAQEKQTAGTQTTPTPAPPANHARTQQGDTKATANHAP